MVETCAKVQASGQANYLDCQIPLPSNFNFEFIEKNLTGFYRPEIIKFLKFGFPLGNTLSLGSQKPQKNHSGASDFKQELKAILHNEIQYNSVLGPFDHPILQDTRFSPLNSVPKKDSTEKRLILDLSMPEGNSINDGIDKNNCLGYEEKLQLPSIDDLVKRIVQLGKGCKVFKIDLKRAYRQIPVCPADIHFLGYVFNGKFYYDCTLSMGSKSSTKACQLVTSVTHK